MLKPIETRYNGYRFRSRLEARWAVFFDAVGIEYRYEAEGFDLDGVWYLPDFWWPERKKYVEIKPELPSLSEWNKCVALATRLKKGGISMFCGEVGIGARLFSLIGFDPPDFLPQAVSYMWEEEAFAECRECGVVDLYSCDWLLGEPGFCWHCQYQQPGMWHDRRSPRILAAFATARSARFEARK